MGYTHYWQREESCPVDAWKKICRDMRRVFSYCKEQGIRLVEEFDCTRRPIANKDEIFFNGYGDQGYETFVVHREGKINQLGMNWFCKTERRAYDLAVQLALLVIAKHDKGFSFTSDGTTLDWAPAMEIFENLFGAIEVPK